MLRKPAKFTKLKKGGTYMKRILGITVMLGMLALYVSSAEAAIKIEIAEVQNGAASVKGNGAQKGA